MGRGLALTMFHDANLAKLLMSYLANLRSSSTKKAELTLLAINTSMFCAQREAIEGYCKRMGFDLDEIITDKLSASTGDHIEHGNFGKVILPWTLQRSGLRHYTRMKN